MTLYVNTIVEATYAGNSSTRPGLVTARLTDNAHIAAPSKRDLEPSLPILHTTFPAPRERPTRARCGSEQRGTVHWQPLRAWNAQGASMLRAQRGGTRPRRRGR